MAHVAVTSPANDSSCMRTPALDAPRLRKLPPAARPQADLQQLGLRQQQRKAMLAQLEVRVRARPAAAQLGAAVELRAGLRLSATR